jgi:hypothetical protein
MNKEQEHTKQQAQQAAIIKQQESYNKQVDDVLVREEFLQI